MRIPKVALVILAIPLALFVGLIAWIFFTFEVLYPLKYSRLQTQTEEWNQKNWSTGTALSVTVRVSSDKTSGSNTAIGTVNCFKKQFARPGGLKGPPSKPSVVQALGPDHLSLSFGKDATHRTPLRDLCLEALRENDEWQLPHTTDSHYYWSHIVTNDQSFSCFLANDPRTTQGQTTRPTFVSVKWVPIRELISAEAYNAVRYKPSKPFIHRHNEPKVPRPPMYYWFKDNVETECWRNRRTDACAPEVEAICGTPLK